MMLFGSPVISRVLVFSTVFKFLDTIVLLLLRVLELHRALFGCENKNISIYLFEPTNSG